MTKLFVRALMFLFVVQIFDGVKWIDASSHTQLVDAQRQETIFKGNGISSGNLRIVEKDAFNPPPRALQ